MAQLLGGALFSGMPPASKAALSNMAHHWGQWVLALPPDDRERLCGKGVGGGAGGGRGGAGQAAGYLAFYHEFMRQYALGWRAATAAPMGAAARAPACGLYLVVSPHPQAAGVAALLAERLGAAGVIAPKDACAPPGMRVM